MNVEYTMTLDLEELVASLDGDAIESLKEHLREEGYIDNDFIVDILTKKTPYEVVAILDDPYRFDLKEIYIQIGKKLIR